MHDPTVSALECFVDVGRPDGRAFPVAGGGRRSRTHAKAPQTEIAAGKQSGGADRMAQKYQVTDK
jgi:hypothetical protein